MYYPQAPKEPSGCVQTLIITRVILGILLVPIAIIAGAMFAIVLAFYALTISPFLGLLAVLIGAAILVGVARWESKRVAREIPRDDT